MEAENRNVDRYLKVEKAYQALHAILNGGDERLISLPAPEEQQLCWSART
jgi:hypothetical protein